MTLQECYEAMQGDYEGVMGRLRMEKMIQKFLLKILEDGNYDLLCSSLESGNWEEFFRAAHSMKGICSNLGITKLQESSSALTEAVRDGQPLTDMALFEQVQKDYKETVQAIEAYKASL